MEVFIEIVFTGSLNEEIQDQHFGIKLPYVNRKIVGSV